MTRFCWLGLGCFAVLLGLVAAAPAADAERTAVSGMGLYLLNMNIHFHTRWQVTRSKSPRMAS